MKIRYGKGGRRTPAAVLNSLSGEIYAIDGFAAPPQNAYQPAAGLTNPTAQMFDYLGGELLEANSEGGIGYIPDNQGFLQCGVLNTDIRQPEVPLDTRLADGRRIVVTSRKLRVCAGSYVMLVRDDAPKVEVIVVSNYATAIHNAITNPDRYRIGPQIRRTMRSFAPWDESGMTCKERPAVLYGAPSAMGVLNMSRILDLLFWGDVYHPGACKKQPSAWEQGLGLATGADGKLYFNASGVLRTAVRSDKPFSEQFGWATFITDPRPGFKEYDLYITLRGDEHRLYSKYPLHEGKVGSRYLLNLSEAEAKAMMHSGTLLPKYVQTLLFPPTD